jgi:hypothetical protein
MNPTVIAAIVSASVSIVVALLGQIFTPLANMKLERHKAELQSQLKEIEAAIQEKIGQKSARRDYEYEARKRLYEEIEPLLFQLYESAGEFNYRIASLARTYRANHLGQGPESWLGHDGYYLKTTAYKWIHPTLIYRLFQSRLTFVDLKLDDVIRLRYLLLRCLVFSFTDAYKFADGEPKLRYEPKRKRSTFTVDDRAVYHAQGFVLGDLENVMDELTATAEKSRTVPFFSEFENLLQTDSKASSSIATILAILRGFSPDTDPVLIRMFCAQAMLCHLLQRSYCGIDSTDGLSAELENMLSNEPSPDWLLWGDTHTAAVSVAKHYVSECLEWIDEQP